jgi:hypothetical protein
VEAPPPLIALARSGEVRGLLTHLRALERHLADDSQLPEAICARYKYFASTSAALRRHHVSPRAWYYVHDLAREVDRPLDVHAALLPYEQYDWHDALEEDFVDMEVIVDSLSLERMLLCSLEAYLSPKARQRKGYEVYGLNLGMARDIHQRRPRDGLRIRRYVSVAYCQPQMSADNQHKSVIPNVRSLEAIITAAATLYPQYQAIGDFHSHPYDELANLDAARGWGYTSADETSNVDLSHMMADLGHRVHVMFVIAIARSRRAAPRSHYKGMRNTIQVSLGNCRAILAAYRSLESGRLTRRNVRLRLAGMSS